MDSFFQFASNNEAWIPIGRYGFSTGAEEVLLQPSRRLVLAGYCHCQFNHLASDILIVVLCSLMTHDSRLMSQYHIMVHDGFPIAAPAGNAMSVPCIGAVLTAILMTCDLQFDHFRLPLSPGPQQSCMSSGSELGHDDNDDDSNGSTEPGGYSAEVRKMWPSISHAGSGYSPRELESFLDEPEGSVLRICK